MKFAWSYSTVNSSVICLKNSELQISKTEVSRINDSTSFLACKKSILSKRLCHPRQITAWIFPANRESMSFYRHKASLSQSCTDSITGIQLSISNPSSIHGWFHIAVQNKHPIAFYMGFCLYYV